VVPIRASAQESPRVAERTTRVVGTGFAEDRGWAGVAVDFGFKGEQTNLPLPARCSYEAGPEGETPTTAAASGSTATAHEPDGAHLHRLGRCAVTSDASAASCASSTRPRSSDGSFAGLGRRDRGRRLQPGRCRLHGRRGSVSRCPCGIHVHREPAARTTSKHLRIPGRPASDGLPSFRKERSTRTVWASRGHGRFLGRLALPGPEEG
jgi:hypothetical protein